MKKLIFLIILLLALPYLSAINLEVQKVGSREVIINNVNEPATFDLKVKNLGSSDNFEFYNLLGFSMAPKGTVLIAGGETKDVQLMIYPREDLNFNGFYTFEYFIQGTNKEKVSEKVTINMIDLKDAFEIGSWEIFPETSSINVYISNKVNFNFDIIRVSFDSPFFELEQDIPLKAFERKEFLVQLNREDFEKLTAGFYTLKADVTYKNEDAKVEGVVKFVEQDLLKTTENDYGFLIGTHVIEKKNQGNVVAESQTTIKKNIISRLFTTLNPEPDSVRRQGFNVYYTWAKEINPGESLKITVRTNWLFPLLVIFFIVAIVVIVKQYAMTNLVLRKKVSFVHAKGGEFALKISIVVGARRHVERISVVDRIPPLVKLYERFGGEKPSRINDKLRRIEWDISNLMPGEKRVLSYVIYSKVGVMGKFALPEATAIYEKEGEIHETSSNKAFFVSEQRGSLE
ncbi:hypothetical protein HYT25_02445 [Candidatus Pacearchaeota archaeon]|nr:hypothetical protein [Candidatus Pacearchaeota archaeon]